MPRILYPAKVEPLRVGSDSTLWYCPMSEPVRRPAPTMLAAAGCQWTPLPPTIQMFQMEYGQGYNRIEVVAY